MNNIEIKEAINRYSCNVCKNRTDNLYELHFGGISICLCTNCLRKTRKVISQAESYISYINMAEEADAERR